MAYGLRISDWSTDVCSAYLLLQGLEPGDHRLDARTRLLVLRQQLRAFAGQLFVLLAQAAVLFGQPAGAFGERVEAFGERAQLFDHVRGVHVGKIRSEARRVGIECGGTM